MDRNRKHTKSSLEEIFNPRSVAVVGVSNSVNAPGAILLSAILEFGYKGNVYPVNLRGEDVQGLTAYRSIRDIPGPADMVIVCTPAQTTIQVIEDCVAKRVKAVVLFTAGYSETGLESRQQLQEDLAAKAKEARVRILGPNCMGIYCPKSGISFARDFPRDSGPVGVLSQSGGNSHCIVREGALRGVRFSKVISYGNASDLNESDLLEYFAEDTETRVIACYVEGVKDGRRFVTALGKAATAKPVMVLKGGDTEEGVRAARGHTGSLAGSREVWAGLLKQKGARQVYTVEELIDNVLPRIFMTRPRGRNVGLIGIGGGESVLAADACSNAGLYLPAFPPEIQHKLRNLVPIEGNIVTNPADLTMGYSNVDLVRNAVQVIGSCQEIDLLILHTAINISPKSLWELKTLDMFVSALIEGVHLAGKPAAMVIHGLFYGADHEQGLKMAEKCYRAGLPVFRSVSGAAKAMDKFCSHSD